MKKVTIDHIYSFKKSYESLTLLMKKYTLLGDFLKIGAMVAVIFFSAFVYLYYINTVSTQGWFFRRERRNLERVQFDHNIASLTTVRLEKQLWDSVTLRAQPHKTIDVTTRIVNLPTIKEIVYRDDY